MRPSIDILPYKKQELRCPAKIKQELRQLFLDENGCLSLVPQTSLTLLKPKFDMDANSNVSHLDWILNKPNNNDILIILPAWA